MSGGVTTSTRRSRARALLLAGAAALGGALGGAAMLLPSMPVAAQEVVQALPPREAAELSTAMRRLSARPTDLEALVTAGNASLSLRDAGAAAGFFQRASALAPADARVILGNARVALVQRRPVDALRGFEAAEAAGVRPLDIAADKGLAHDLVGDPLGAQALYNKVLDAGENPEVRRRLALSYAIAGNRAEFERALYPQLRDEDRAAYRTRAFGLAILGRTDEAVSIADTMMSTDLALRMAPYLRYMPRLTRAQQAAAGNLGAFPAAADIGRDAPEIAAYASAGTRIAARADTSLTPTGAPLGTRRPGPAPTPSARPVTQRAPTPAPATARAPAPAPTRIAQAELPPVSAKPTPTPTPAPIVRPTPTPTPAPTPTLAPAPAVVVPTAPEPLPARPSLEEAFADFDRATPAAAAPAPDAVDIARLAAERNSAEAKAAREAEARAARDKAARDKAAKAAADKAAKEKAEKAAKEKAEKAAKAAEPARYWLQVGVGRNTAAYGLDWKKLAKQAGGTLDGKGPWAVKYGATNRMLAGPYPSAAAANSALKKLKDKGIEALPFRSDEGEKVTKAG